MSLYPDAAASRKIDSMISRMLVNADPDRPVTTEGFVRTFLYPSDSFRLPEERAEALRDYARGAGAENYYVKLLAVAKMHSPPEAYVPADLAPPSSDEEIAAFEARLQTWRPLPVDVYWRGSWSEGGIPDHPDLMEHVLLDEVAAWAFLFSEEDHAYLVAAPATSREILSAFGTTPEHELDEYVSYLDRYVKVHGDVESDEVKNTRRILDHARTGLWS